MRSRNKFGMTAAPNQHTINHPMKKNILFLSAVVIAFTACKPKTEKPTDVEETPTAIAAPEWSKNANIYEVNLRQYTPEGTIKAFEQHVANIRKDVHRRQNELQALVDSNDEKAKLLNELLYKANKTELLKVLDGSN